MTSRTRETPHTRSMKACTTCRQAKLRCDATSLFPSPCSRCKNVGRICVFNPAFKRTPTRSKLDHVTEQLEDLRRQLLGGSGERTPNAASKLPQIHPLNLQTESEAVPASVTVRLAHGATDRTSEDLFAFRATSTNPTSVKLATLGNVEIIAPEILDLFGFFIKHQYYHMPILDTRVSITTIQENTPFLFWTIIMVTCRYHPSYCHLLPLLKDSYLILLGRAMATSPMSLRTIQALLLFCCWPLPCRKQPQDPSWNICGIVVNACIYHGLDSPKDQRWVNLGTEESNIRKKIWLACFHIATVWAVHLGVSLPIKAPPELATISYILEKADIPPRFAAEVEIQRQVARYMAVFTTDQSCPFNTSAMKIFESELDSVSSKFRLCWNIETECSLLRAKLNLYALTCIYSHEPNFIGSSSITHTDSYDGIQVVKLAGLRAAIKLIHTFSDMVDDKAGIINIPASRQDEHNIKPAFCIPKRYFGHNTFATIFLLKFCAFNNRFSQSDRDLAQNYIKSSHDTLARISTHPLDEPARTAEVIQVLSKREDPELRIKDRQGASIYYDALQKAAELRGRQVDDSIPEIMIKDKDLENRKGTSVEGSETDHGNHLFQLDSLDLWPSYLQLPVERWPFENSESFTETRMDQYVGENFGGYMWNSST